MPSIDVNLQGSGPLFTVFLSLSHPRAQAVLQAGQQLPAPVVGQFLIDTGASCTCVDADLIKPLGLQPTGKAGIMTPSTQQGQPHFCDQYDVSLFIPDATGNAGHVIQALPIIETHLKSQGIDGLIGRDVLNKCLLIYNGTAGIITLAY